MSSNEYQPVLNFDKVVTIADGETESDAVDIGGTSVVGLAIPAGFDGTEITFKAAQSLGGTYQTVKNSDNLVVTLTCQANAYFVFYPSDLAGVRFIKLVAGTAQTGDIELTLVTRPL